MVFRNFTTAKAITSGTIMTGAPKAAFDGIPVTFWSYSDSKVAAYGTVHNDGNIRMAIGSLVANKTYCATCVYPCFSK